jgi:hypothetical protein
MTPDWLSEDVLTSRAMSKYEAMPDGLYNVSLSQNFYLAPWLGRDRRANKLSYSRLLKACATSAEAFTVHLADDRVGRKRYFVRLCHISNARLCTFTFRPEPF